VHDKQVRWGKIGGQQASEAILVLLSKGGRYFTNEIEKRFSQTPWIVLDQLIALQANERLVSVRVPEKRQFLWHKATHQLNKLTENLRMLEGAERLSALVNFTQMFTPLVQLLSEERAARAEKDPS